MAAPPQKRCLYEVLGLSRECSPDEIRSAYRKLALQRHPDKLVRTGVSEADATAQFQELSNAYEVLSDARERAWYDSHRSQILFADSKPSSSKSSKSSVIVPDLFPFFSNSVFNGYSDSGKGFYNVYAGVFDRVYQSEVTFAQKMGVAPPKEAPLMGNLNCHYAQVTAFYSYWAGFATVMDFCWVDEYDAMAGQDRRMRRKMDDENKKLRKKACREYNETVRGLAGFVKKRDKRVIDMQRKKAEEAEKKKEEEKARKKEMERLKAERARQYEEPDWAHVDELEDDDYDYEEEAEESSKKGDLHELYCVACGKKFKSDKQWKNHEQSKKHKERVAELKEAFDEEDGVFGEFKEDTADREDDPVDEIVEEDKVDDGESTFVSAAEDMYQEVDDLRDQFADTVEIQDDDDKNDDDHDDDDDGELHASEKEGYVGTSKKGVDHEMGSDGIEGNILEDMISGYKSQKQKKKGQVETDSVEMDYMEYNNVKGSQKNKGRRKQRGQARDKEAAQPEPSVAANGQPKNNGNGDSTPKAAEPDLSEADGQPDESKPEDSKNQKNRKLTKPAADKKGSGKQDNKKSKEEPTKGRKKKGNVRASGNGCDTCGEEFESRNKLHRHLGETGHASLKSK